jgi:hypothetical protein
MPSLFFQSGQTSQRSSHPLSKSYELTGEGLREAVKNGDVGAVKDLLSQGLDANYFDKQGMSLLHLVRPFLYMSSRIFVTLFPCTEFGVCGFCDADNRVVITCTFVALLFVSCRQQCSTSQRSHSC